MRGKAIQFCEQSCHFRITPAYAGKSGEEQEKGFLILGSPPPMRGKGKRLTLFLKALKITPAYAGKSLSKQWHLEKPRDHPRLCGEKPQVHSVQLADKGSPPPMRGKGRK